MGWINEQQIEVGDGRVFVTPARDCGGDKSVAIVAENHGNRVAGKRIDNRGCFGGVIGKKGALSKRNK
jgi:hypothetical protein